jgi:adenylate kinase family enzyme
MKRIAIVGNAAGEKSTLAVRLAAALGVPRHALDDIQWNAGWSPAPPDAYARDHGELVRGDTWIIDGLGNMASVEERLAAADTVVFVDLALWRHYWWAFKRQVKSLFRRDPYVPEGCSLPSATWPLMTMMWDIDKKRRPKLVEAIDRLGAAKSVYRLRSPADIEAFLRRAAPHDAREAGR